jgi:hypothetical protein
MGVSIDGGRQDQWATPLGERRHGRDGELLRRRLEFLAPIRETRSLPMLVSSLDSGYLMWDAATGSSPSPPPRQWGPPAM